MSINILYVNRDTVCRSAVVPNWLMDIDMECSSVNMGQKKKTLWILPELDSSWTELEFIWEKTTTKSLKRIWSC